MRFCYHPNATTKVTDLFVRKECPDCPAWSATLHGSEPMALVPWALPDAPGAAADEGTTP